MLGGQLVAGTMLCNALISKFAVSINTVAGPSAPARSPCKDLNCERQTVTVEFGRLQNDDGVTDRCFIFAED